MKTFESGMNTITVDNTGKVLKMDSRTCWSFDIIIHKDWQDCLSCFHDDLLFKFKSSQPSNMKELKVIFDEVAKEHDLTNDSFNNEVCIFDKNKLTIGWGYDKDEVLKRPEIIQPIITFKKKRNEKNAA